VTHHGKEGNGLDVKHIFHPTDFTEESEMAFAHALKIALAAKANLNIFHVHEKRDDEEWTEFPSVRNMLIRWNLLPEGTSRDDVKTLGLGIQKIQGMKEDPVASILGYLESFENDLIVLATHQQKGIDRLLHNAIAEPVARLSKKMTLFVPQGQKGFVSPKDGAVNLRRVLIPVDQNPIPQPALDAASALVQLLDGEGAEFTIVHVGSHNDLPPYHFSKDHDWQWETLVATGGVVEQILKTSEDRAADLIVMATQGHQGFLDALRGSTTERVLREAHCPILAVPVE